MSKAAGMRHEIFWQRGKAIGARDKLAGSRSANVVIIGGGVAGLTVADELVRRGVEDIVVLEARFCGAGASGRSSGFITPASELSVSELRRRFGDDEARMLWDLAQGGCDSIRETIERYQIECGYLPADSLYIASDESSFHVIEEEHQARLALGYASRLYDRSDLPQVIGSTSYDGAVRSGQTFAINSFDYVRALSDRLADRGVRILENSAVTAVNGDEVRTGEGVVRARSLFFCLDHGAGSIGIAPGETYHAQAFLTISEPLDPQMSHSLFPDGPQLVWDTDLVYQYFRLTSDRRLLVGGGLLSRTYARERRHDMAPVHHLLSYIRDRFPQIIDVCFEAWWQGLIGVTKDFLPLVGTIRDSERHYVVLCAAGLPWSTFAAQAAVRMSLDGESHLDRFFKPDRSFTEIDLLQPLIPKPLTFALSHGYAKSYLRGDERKVSRRKRLIGAAALAGAAAGLLKLIGEWSRL